MRRASQFSSDRGSPSPLGTQDPFPPTGASAASVPSHLVGSNSPALSESSSESKRVQLFRNATVEDLLWIPSIAQLYHHCRTLKANEDFANKALQNADRAMDAMEQRCATLQNIIDERGGK